MAQLKKEIKLYIVRALAVFNTPAEVADAVKQEFNVNISRQRCEAYDPTKRVGHNLSLDLKTEFEETRADFLAKPKNIPISNLSYRMQQYQSQLDNAGSNKTLKLKVLEQAAQDIGGKFTNKQEFTGENGASLSSVTVAVVSKDAVKTIMQDLENEY